MIVSIHQPSYFPWIGLLDKINKSDVYVYLDTVQLTDSGYQNRNIFLDNQFKEQLLTIPINKKNYINKKIVELELNNKLWQKKHNKFIYFNYKKHPFFDEIYPFVNCFYNSEYNTLSDVLFESMKLIIDLIGIETTIIKASELELNQTLRKEEMLFDILSITNASIYLSGIGAKSYQKNENFEEKNIKLIYQKISPPAYSQYKNDNFIYGLSSLDMLFNIGIKQSTQLLGNIR